LWLTADVSIAQCYYDPSVAQFQDFDSKTMTVSLKDIYGTVVFRQAIAAKGR